MIDLIRTNATRLSELHGAIHRTATTRSVDGKHLQAWETACRAFHSQYDALAFPGGLSRAYDLIRSKDGDLVEPAIAFLEADPFFFRSGYIKADLLRAIAAMELSPNQRARLRLVVLERVQAPTRREFRRYCHLAKVIATPTFVSKLQELEGRAEGHTARNAMWVLSAIAGK